MLSKQNKELSLLNLVFLIIIISKIMHADSAIIS